MLYQRTGPEGTLGPWLLLSSRVALLSVNIRYTVSVIHTSWCQSRGYCLRQWAGSVRGNIFFGLKSHQSPQPMTLPSAASLRVTSALRFSVGYPPSLPTHKGPLWRLKTLNLTSVFTGMIMWDVVYAPASQGYGWICWWSLLIRATTFVFWAPAKTSLSGR